MSNSLPPRQLIKDLRDLGGIVCMVCSRRTGNRKNTKAQFRVWLSFLCCAKCLGTERVSFTCSFAFKLCGEGAKLNTVLADDEKDQLSKLTLREVRAALAAQAIRPPSTGVLFCNVEGTFFLDYEIADIVAYSERIVLD